MEGKKSFVLYTDLMDIVNDLSDEQAGKLVKLIVNYVNDRNPETDDLLINIAFKPIKMQLKRDLEKWNDIKVKRSESGKLGGRPKAIQEEPNESEKKQIEAKKANGFFDKQIKAKKAVNVNVNVNDNVTVNDNVNDIYITEQAKFYFNKNSLDGNYISKMMKVHSQSELVINTELEKWIVKNEETVFNDLKHMKNSFNIWMMNYKPELVKSVQKPKIESKADQYLKELLEENEKQEGSNY